MESVAFLDAGNTRMKLGLFTRDGKLETTAFFGYDTVGLIALKAWLQERKIKEVLASNVSKYKLELDLIITEARPLAFRHYSVNYDTPDTLGTDRLLAAIGAASLFPLKDLLVIDAGTCITTDLFTAVGGYQGGSISPGVRLRFLSMHEHTGSLPYVEPETYSLPGKSTKGSLLAGVMEGLRFELQGWINFYQQQYPGLIPVIAGGDAQLLAAQLENHPIFVESELVLYGLHALHQKAPHS